MNATEKIDAAIKDADSRMDAAASTLAAAEKQFLKALEEYKLAVSGQRTVYRLCANVKGTQ